MTWQELTQNGVSDDTIRAGVSDFRRGKSSSWVSMKDPEDKRKCLVQYESIPPRTRGKLPSAEALLLGAQSKQLATEQLQAAMAASSNQLQPLATCLRLELKDRALALAEHTSLTEATQLMRLAAWLRLSVQTQEGYKTREGYLRAVVDAMAPEYENGLIYGATISNWQVLDRKAKSYLKAGLSSLIDGRNGNQNAVKLSHFHKLFVYALAQSGQKLDDTYIWQLMEEARKTVEWQHLEAVSRSTVSRWLRQPATEALLARSRYGKAYARTQVEPYHKRSVPNYSLSLICGDGLRLGMPVRVPHGHALVPQATWKRRSNAGKHADMLGQLMVYIWFDAATGAIVGYDFDIDEPAALVRKSLRNVLQTTGGAVPKEAIFDRKTFANAGVKQLMEGLGIQYDDSKEPNAPWQNPAERFNKELNKWLRRTEASWVTITNHHKDYVHNPDLRVLPGDRLDADQAMTKFSEVVAMYNADVAPGRPSKLDDCLARMNPACAQLDELNRVCLFGQYRLVTVHNGLLDVTVETRKHSYELADYYDFLKHTSSKKVWLYFDEADMSEVHVMIPDASRPDDAQAATYYATVRPAGTYNISRVERTQEEWSEVARQAARDKKYRMEVATDAERLMNEAEDLNLIALGRSVAQHRSKAAMSNVLLRQQTEYVQDGWRDRGSRFGQVDAQDSDQEKALVPVEANRSTKVLSNQERQRLLAEKLREYQ